MEWLYLYAKYYIIAAVGMFIVVAVITKWANSEFNVYTMIDYIKKKWKFLVTLLVLIALSYLVYKDII